MLNEKPLVGAIGFRHFHFLCMPGLEDEIDLNHFTSGMIVAEQLAFPVAHGYCGVHS